MKYIVTFPVETKVAMLVEASSEDEATDIAETFVEEGREELLLEYLDPIEHIVFSSLARAEQVEAAEPHGYENHLAINEELT